MNNAKEGGNATVVINVTLPIEKAEEVKDQILWNLAFLGPEEAKTSYTIMRTQ